MSTLWIKICGVTRRQDALAAARLGANAIGLNFYPASPRSIQAADIATIAAELPGECAVVALFVDPAAEEVEAVLDTGLVDLLQFHGAEDPEFCGAFGLPYLKAIRVGMPGQKPLHELAADYVTADMILVDSFDKKVPGGTGKVFDWGQAESLAATDGIKLVVAGGLNAHNVSEVVAQLRPYGVDVSGGVEVSPGIKEFEKMQQFIEGARSVDS